jgi:hypothetical protein
VNARTDTRPIGVVKGMPFDEYLQVDAMSQSALKELARSPWHYANRVDVKETRAMLNGSLVHCARLEPDALAQRYVMVPEDAPKRPAPAQWAAKKSNESSQIAKDWWNAFGEEVAGRSIIPAADYAIMQLQLAALNREPQIVEDMTGGDSEVSVFWIDPITGVYCKARPDYVRQTPDGDILTDLKSTVDESPSGFGRAAARMRYDLQQAHYVDGWQIATGRKVAVFSFAAVTSKPPVLAKAYLLPEEFAMKGEAARCELLATYANCRRTDTWPDYGAGRIVADVPAYALPINEIEVGFAED